MKFSTEDEAFMGEALAEAKKALDEGEVAVGCVITAPDVSRRGGYHPPESPEAENGVLIRAHNRVQQTGDLTAHAEMLAIRSLPRYALSGAALYVTMEPCPMCAGAIALSGIARVVYGAGDPAYGCCGSVYRLTEDPAFPNFAKADEGCRESECRDLLTQSMKKARE